MDTFEKIEEYVSSVEEYFFSSLSTVAHGLPDVHEVATRLWIDISRYGPGLPAFPEVRIPSLGDFQVPPPPPPPPPPSPTNWLGKCADWAGEHPWKATGIMVTAVGSGLLVGYGYPHSRKKRLLRARAQQTKAADRRQVVVVLGGDSPLGLPLILDLEKKGYIVIVSVATPEAVEPLEAQTQGYVKALVLNPYEPLMIPAFLRSLSATLSRKFPLNAAGDPYAPLSTHPYVHSIISLLTLPPNSTSTLAPLEHVSLPETYLPYLTATHITPLQVIQALLPLLRTLPAISRDIGEDKSILVCLPVTETRVGVAFSGVRSMSAVSTLRGIEVLRREIKMAATSGKGGEAMKNVKVVVLDVGAVAVTDEGSQDNENVGQRQQVMDNQEEDNAYKSMIGWTASEKVMYGPAFVNVFQGVIGGRRKQSAWEMVKDAFKGTWEFGTVRRPTDVQVFVNTVVSVVGGGKGDYKIYGVGLGLGRAWNWVRGDRISVGAGAHTYKVASYLPSLLLDCLLNIPHWLIEMRNKLIMNQPFRLPADSTTGTSKSKSTSKSNTSTSPGGVSQTLYIENVERREEKKKEEEKEKEKAEKEETESETEETSDHDVESLSGDSGSGVDSSWVSLNGSQSDIHLDGQPWV